jgi:hypothetical protein
MLDLIGMKSALALAAGGIMVLIGLVGLALLPVLTGYPGTRHYCKLLQGKVPG